MVLRGRVTFAALLLLLLFAALPGLVQADPKEQFNKGVELAEQGDFSGAVSVFLGVMDQLPSAERGRAHKALGFCYRKLGKLPEAWHHLNSYVAAGNKADESAVRWLSEVRAELSATHKLVQFTCTDADAWFDPVGTGRFACPGQWWLKPGKYEIDAGTTAKSTTLSVEVPAGAGETGPVVVVEFPPELPETVSVEQPLLHQGGNTRLWPWITLGTGTGMLVVGGLLNYVGYDRNETLRSKYADSNAYPDGPAAQGLYDDSYSKEVQPLMTSTYVLYGVGGAAVIAGLVWLLLDSPGPQPSSAFQVIPFIGPGEAGAQVQLGF